MPPPKSRLLLFVLISSLAIAAPALFAQGEKATIVGALSDPTGAAIPGATITIKSQATSAVVIVSTDESGQYVSPPLRPGAYTVSVEKQGFKRTVQTIQLDVNQRARLNFELAVGQVAESISVTGSAPLLETQNAALGNVRTTKAINDLPLNGRNFVQLFHIATGVIPVGGGPTLGPSASNQLGVMGGSVNGSRPSNNDFRFDSIQSQDTDQNVLIFLPPVDAIQEFKVQMNAMDASFGRNGGATVNLVVKSGTNRLSGTAYEFLRNSALDARNFFDRERPPFKLNQFGGSAGGPIRRDRTFFFGDYQGTRIRQAQTLISTVPIVAFRSGDFSRLPLTIFDPSTTRPDPNNPGRVIRDPFQNNIIPSARFNTTGKRLADLYPLPNFPGDPIINNFLFNPVRRANIDQFDARIDHRFRDSDSFFGRYSFSNTSAFNPSRLPAPALGGGGQRFPGNNNTRGQQFVLSDVHTFAPNKIYEGRFGFSRLHILNTGELLGTNLADQVGIPGINVEQRFSGLGPIGVSGFVGLGEDSFTPVLKVTNNFEYVQQLSYVRGKHSLKFGYDLARRQFNQQSPAFPEGTFSFSGQFTQNPASASGTGSGLADMLLGLTSSARLDIEPVFGHRRWEHAWYINDDFRFSRKLTVNIGLRYEIVAPLSEVFDREGSLVPELRNVFKVNTPELPGHTVTKTNYQDFAPRVGFAYSVGAKTVLRAGYGIFYSAPGIASGRLPSKTPPVAGNFSINNNSFATNLSTVTPISSGFPLARPAVFDPTGRDFKFSPRNDPDSYVQQWNVNIERQLGFNTVLTLAYVGSRGVHLNVFPNINQPFPGPGGVAPRRPFPNLANADGVHKAADSIYHSLQVTAEKRFSNGLSFLSAYSYSHSIDDASQDTGGGPQDPRCLRCDRGNSDFDIRHRYVLSWSYELPFGRARKYLSAMGTFGQALLGGWQLNGIETFMTGAYFTPGSAQNTLGAGAGGQFADRIANGNLPPSQRTLQPWFDPSAFRTPPPFTFGNAGRNILEGPGTAVADLSIFKDFPISRREGSRMQFRAEFFNLPNSPQFNGPNAAIGDPAVGQIRSAGDPFFFQRTSRQIQFALKYYY